MSQYEDFPTPYTIKKPQPIIIETETCSENKYPTSPQSRNHLSARYAVSVRLKHSPKTRTSQPATPSNTPSTKNENFTEDDVGESKGSKYSLGHISSPMISRSIWNTQSKSLSIAREIKYHVALHLKENDEEVYLYEISIKCLGDKFKQYLERNRASDNVTHIYLPSYINPFFKEEYKEAFILYLVCAVQDAHTIDENTLTEQDIFFLLLVAYRFKDIHPIELLVDVNPFLVRKFPLLTLLKDEDKLWRRIELGITTRKISPLSKSSCVLL